MVTLKNVVNPVFSLPFAIFEDDGQRLHVALGDQLLGGFTLREVLVTSDLAGCAVMFDCMTGEEIVVETGDEFFPEDFH